MKRARVGAQRWTMGGVVLASMILTPLASRGDDRYWVGGTSGWWDESTNWSPSGQPQAGDNAYLTQSDEIDRTVDYRSALDPLLGNLTIDATDSGTITFLQSLDSLSAYYENVGDTGNGSYIQSGGMNAPRYLALGVEVGATGAYDLDGIGILSAFSESIGVSGVGTFRQSSATNTIAGGLILGSNVGGTGTYNLSDTGVLSAAIEQVGYSGTGTFTQSGGANTITTSLTIGNSVGGTGTYDLSGTGVVSAPRERIGVYGTGTFTQSGGTNAVTTELTVAHYSDSVGTYNLSGTAILSAASENVGLLGTGTFNQSGGTNTVTGQLFVGRLPGSTGTYNLSDTGTLSVGNHEYIGQIGGTGTFTQSGGTHTIAGVLYVGQDPGGTGIYSLSASGTLSACDNVIGRSGVGTLNQSGGTNTMRVNGLYLGYEADGTGTYNQSDGTLSGGREEVIGRSGTGTFTQTGGTNAADELKVAVFEGSTGTYNLSDTGSLTTDGAYVGIVGTGTFNQTGGTNTTNTLTIKADTTGSGLYNLEGGTLNATTVVNNDRFNYSGGTLNGNFLNSTDALFTLSGTGTRTVNGDVTNDGTIKVTGATEGTTAVFTGTFINNGILDTDPARLEFHGDLIIGPDGSIYASSGDQYVLYEDLFINNSSAADLVTAAVQLVFAGAGTHLLSLNSLDLIANEVSLEDGAVLDFDGSGSLYASIVSGLVFDPDGIVANISAPTDFTLLYDPAQNPGLSGIYTLSGGGTLNPMAPVPLPGAVLLGMIGVGYAGCRLRRSRE